MNSRVTSRTQTWSRASDSQPRQCPDLSSSPPYTRHVSASNLSPEGSLPLHSGETSRTRTWSRASDSQPRQSPDVSRTRPATRHVSASTPNISSAGSSPNLSPDTSDKLYLEALECIPLLPYDVPLDWTSAYPFLLTADLANLRKYQISTVDYVPQPAHKLLRTCFESVLYAIDKLPDVNVPNDSPTQAAYIQRHLKPLLHRLYLALPALLLPHDRNLGKHSRQDIIKGRCQKFLAGQWRSLYDSAIKAFALKRPRTAKNDPDHVQQRKNKRALILTKKGNLSKAYKALTQDGLVDHDAIETLRKQHRREHIPPLDLLFESYSRYSRT